MNSLIFNLQEKMKQRFEVKITLHFVQLSSC